MICNSPLLNELLSDIGAPQPVLPQYAPPMPTQPTTSQLPSGLPLVLVEQLRAWARVVGSNGWTGWVDGRLLHRRG